MEAAAVAFGDREAYDDGSRRLTFTRRGDVVAIAPPPIDYAIASAAIVRVGAVAPGLNLRLGPPRGHGNFPVRAAGARVRRRTHTAGWLAGSHGAVDATGARGCDGSCARARRAGQPSDPVVIIWTSGNTGVPKGAWIDHDNLRAGVTTAGVMSAPFDRRLVPTPFAHAGYMAKVWEQLAWGMTLVISPPWTAAATVTVQGATYHFEAQAELLAEALDATTEWIAAA